MRLPLSPLEIEYLCEQARLCPEMIAARPALHAVEELLALRAALALCEPIVRAAARREQNVGEEGQGCRAIVAILAATGRE